MPLHHKSLSLGRWQSLTLAEQMGNIGSEISRAKNWQGKDEKIFQDALERALELLDLTIADTRWMRRLKELTRARETLCDALIGGREYKTTLDDLKKYFDTFAFAARKNK